MSTLTVTSKGQITLRREVLRHLGMEPGGKLELELLPGGVAGLRAQPAGTIHGFVGLLAGKTRKVATLEEMEQAASEGWSGTR